MRYAAFVLFILAISTDGVDGYLARRRNLVTDVGIILDPIADKILTGAALVVLSALGELWWWVTIVILVREFGITIMRFVVLRDRVIPASRGGKLKTIFQAVAISLFLLAPWRFLGEWAGWASAAIMGVAVVLTIITGIDYLWQAWRKNRTKA
jgi:CDP-diacylglycerol--glycerol-3-phosphate 3-phosphatidyltransferase